MKSEALFPDKQDMQPNFPAGPLRDWRVKFVRQKGYPIKFRGLQIIFAAGENRVTYGALRAGRLKLVQFPDRLELHESRKGGFVQVLGRADYDESGCFSVKGRLVADKKGPVIARPEIGRFVSADTLFPVLGRQRNVNYYFGDNAFVVYGGRRYHFPTDPQARFGLAARERRLFFLAVPDTGRIHFYEQAADGGKGSHIGWMRIDVPLAEGKCVVRVADHIKEFGLKDQPVRLHCGIAKVIFRGAKLLFSVKRRNLYHHDLRAGRLFLRTGFDERVEVVRKMGIKEEVLGKIAIRNNCLIVGDREVALDQYEKAGPVVRVEEAIEALGAWEGGIKPGRHGHYADFEAHGITFLFPMRQGNVHLARLKSGQLAARVYESRIEIGCKENDEFREIGRVNFDRTGVVLDPLGVLGRQVVKSPENEPMINLAKLVPEIGRTERMIGPGHNRFVSQTVYRSLSQCRNERYYNDFLAGRLVFRTIGARLELFADRGETREFIGLAAFDQRQSGDLTKIFPAVKFNEDGFRELAGLLAHSNYDDLTLLFNGGGLKLNLLKKVALFSRDYLTSSEFVEMNAIKLFHVLGYGVGLLSRDNTLSNDLKQSFSQELLASMTTYLADPRLAGKVDSLRCMFRDALSCLAGTEIGAIKGRDTGK